MDETQTIAEQVLGGSRRALARLLTLVENEREGAAQALAVLFAHTGRARIIGVTGPPGAGKSTLVSALAQHYRTQSQTVAILAVDPTSPFSGGAILGDRIRMQALAGDPGVFIRSMATRGNPGGLALAARDAIRVLDAAGFAVILVETVGAGQSEVDIAQAAASTVVVTAPGGGDDIQAIKAGLLEIADVLVVNKADRPEAAHTARQLETMLALGWDHHRETGWVPPVLTTVALEHQGIDAVAAALDQHWQHLSDTGLGARLARQRIEAEIRDRLRAALLADLLRALPQTTFADIIDRVVERELDPHSAIRTILIGHDI